MSQCYCGSRQPFSQCCQPIIEQKQSAQTAEQLMRSRYSAFTTGAAKYLVDTLHSSKRTPHLLQELEKYCEITQFKSLTVHHALEHQVKFSAVFKDQFGFFKMTETSNFVFEGGRWYYVDGDHHCNDDPLKPNRNETCICGSGKKFKRCCGA